MSIVVCVLLVFGGYSAVAATNISPSVEYADVTNTLALCVDGDTLQLPAGSATWTNLMGSNVVGAVSHATTAGSVTNLPVTVPMGTNSWALDTAFPMNTNKLLLTSGAATGGMTNVSQVQAVGAQYAELLVKATGDITFTNPAAWVTSDMVDSRTGTNGNIVKVAVEVVPGVATNMAVVQFSKR